MITDRQTRLLRQKRMEGKTQETAAAKAGMSVRSARKWQSGPLPSQARWRTRPDPFDGVWEDDTDGQAEGNDNYRLAGRSIPGGSARPSCGRCYRIGTGSVYFPQVQREPSTSPTAGNSR